MRSTDTMRVAVTGLVGQVVSSMIARAPHGVELIALGRPQLDLARRDTVIATLRATRCDVIVNAAAYTAVDKAESEPKVAMLVNGAGAGHVADMAAELGVPLLHLSTDYVFDGTFDRPYRETDPTTPAGAYGRSKVESEQRISKNCANHAILRTAWVYSPYGTNFVKTMLRLGENRAEIGVVADQFGNPTSALDIADALFAIAQKMRVDSSSELRGVFHMTGSGEATWADFAEFIFAEAVGYGRAPVAVKRIATTDYPTLARRPVNSRLDNTRLRQAFGISLPDWRESTKICVAQLLAPHSA